MTGSVTTAALAQTYAGSTLPDILSLTRNGGAPGDAASLSTAQTIAFQEGSGTAYYNLVVTTNLRVCPETSLGPA